MAQQPYSQIKARMILDALDSHGAMTIREFASTFGIKYKSWNPVFTFMRQDGLVELTGESRSSWAITQHGGSNLYRITEAGKTELSSRE